ncbi:MAG: DinB family protein [candidate division KSB1 bacterium]
MEQLQHYRRLFQYDAWANREVFAALKQSEKFSPRALKFLAHIIAAEILWLERIKGEPQSLAVWPELTVEQCEAHLARITNLWRDYFDTLAPEGLSRAIAYTNTKGETFRSPVKDILMHVIMHAAYHRGQIATDTRAAGHTPAYTDFIHAARSGFLQ